MENGMKEGKEEGGRKVEERRKQNNGKEKNVDFIS